MPHHISCRYGVKYKCSGSRRAVWPGSAWCKAKGWPEEQRQDLVQWDRNGCPCGPGRSKPFPGWWETFGALLGSLAKEAQAFQHLPQEPEQPFLAKLSLWECLQRLSDPPSGDSATVNTGAGHL